MREELLKAWKAILAQDGFATLSNGTCRYFYEGKHCVIGKILSARGAEDAVLEPLRGAVDSLAFSIPSGLESFTANEALLEASQRLHDAAAQGLLYGQTNREALIHELAEREGRLDGTCRAMKEAMDILKEALDA